MNCNIDSEVTRCALTAAVMKVERETQETLAVIEYELQECGEARTPKQAALARLAIVLNGYAVSLQALLSKLKTADLSSGASRRELLYPVFIEASACIDTAQAWRNDTADTIKEQVRRLDDAASIVPVDSGAVAGTGQPPRPRMRSPEAEEERRRKRDEKYRSDRVTFAEWERFVTEYQESNLTEKFPSLAMFEQRHRMEAGTLAPLLDRVRQREKRKHGNKR